MEMTISEVLRIMDASRYDDGVSEELRKSLQVLYPKIRNIINMMSDENLI